MSDVLTPEEVNALLKGVSSGEVDTDSVFGAAAGEVRDLDLSNPDWIKRTEIPPLDFVNQLLARHLLNSIRSMLNDQAEVTSDAPVLQSYSDYVVSLERPTSIHLAGVPQLDSQMLFVLNADLILNYVDFYYGGDGAQEGQQSLTRDFTVTEIRVAEGLRKQAADFMSMAWDAVVKLEFEDLGTESNPEFSNFFNPAEVMAVSRFTVSLAEKNLGWLDIVIPSAALAPFHRDLEASTQGDQSQTQSRWTAVFEERVRNTEVELTSVLSTTQVNLGELVKLRVGDILSFDLPPTIELTAGSVPLFKGTFGISNGHNAVQILERLE